METEELVQVCHRAAIRETTFFFRDAEIGKVEFDEPQNAAEVVPPTVTRYSVFHRPATAAWTVPAALPSPAQFSFKS
jgi:hypothetical protein